MRTSREKGSCSNRPYGQCGGKTWKGQTCCPKGFSCKGSGDYYSQCQPTSYTMAETHEATGIELHVLTG